MLLPQIIQLPKITDPRGNLTFLQNPDQLPFVIKRTFWTYDVPGGETRGGHAYRSQQEIIIALSGSFDVVITNQNNEQQIFSLNRSYYGLFLPANTWRHMQNFSTNSLSLHLSDSLFNKEDYIREFETFQKNNL
ncbi:MAG: WxcM-like domain-containing protein [Bacteroidetes bacterium]|nr:WxcM-like domain-containing protein [Bacteroidota bacterium]